MTIYCSKWQKWQKYDWKRLEFARTGEMAEWLKLLEMTGTDQKWIELSYNCWKWIAVARNDYKRL